jgi:toluene monooxygenase system ferredoxin subunit
MLRRVAAVDDLWSGELLACEADGLRIVLAHAGDGVYAYEDRCPHLGFPLSRGEFAGARLTCAAHHWQFDMRSGRGVNPPDACLRAVPVVIRDDAIYGDAAAIAPAGGEAQAPPAAAPVPAIGDAAGPRPADPRPRRPA